MILIIILTVLVVGLLVYQAEQLNSRLVGSNVWVALRTGITWASVHWGNRVWLFSTVYFLDTGIT